MMNVPKLDIDILSTAPFVSIPLRPFLAGMALQGILACDENWQNPAKSAVRLADKLIEELEKQTEEQAGSE